MKSVVWCCCTFVYNGCTVVAKCYLISVQQYCGGFPHRMYVYERTEFNSILFLHFSKEKRDISYHTPLLLKGGLKIMSGEKGEIQMGKAKDRGHDK